MYWLTFALIFLGLTALFVLSGYSLGIAIKKQANKDIKKKKKELHRFFAPIPRPGSFSFIVREGKVERPLENIVGWKLEEQKGMGGAKCFTTGEQDEPSNFLQYLLQHYLGVVWIGIFTTIKVFADWKWSEYKQEVEEENGKKVPKFKLVPREEAVSDFFFQFPYPVTLDDAEIKDNIRVKIDAIFTVWHLHPVRAFFLNKDPVSLFNAMVQATLRSYVAEMDFNKVKAIKASGVSTDAGDNLFWEVLKELNGIVLDQKTGKPNYDKIDHLGLFGKLGYCIVRGEVIQVMAIGETAKALEAARLAELTGNADVMTAQKEAEALDIKRRARAQWVQDTIVSPTGGAGPHVAEVLIAEQVAGSKVTTWVKGGGAIVAVPPGDAKQ